MANKITLHTLLTGEINMRIVIKGKKLADIPMGTDPKAARSNAKEFIDAMKNAPELTDQIT